VRLVPDSRDLTDPEAAAVLSGMPKPVQCVAARDGDVLNVHCAPLSTDNLWWYDGIRRAREGVAGSPDESDYERFLRQGDGRIVLVGAGEYVSLTLPEFAAFERDYAFLGRYTVLCGPPAEYGIAEGDELWARWYSGSTSSTEARVVTS
jgi:hypothetical protein